MTDILGFRPAIKSDVAMLDDLTLEGLRHWGYAETFPALLDQLANELPEGDEIERSPVFILEEGDSVVGFYGLRDRGDHAELLRMFLRVDHIDRGYGRRLWNHAIVEAAAIGDRMLIMSDPKAIGFYQAMGATLERLKEVAPDFSLGVLWYDLTNQ